jgi:hypothetical protein
LRHIALCFLGKKAAMCCVFEPYVPLLHEAERSKEHRIGPPENQRGEKPKLNIGRNIRLHVISLERRTDILLIS